MARKKKSATPWQDFGNEVMDGVHNVFKRGWKEATCRPDSWNQKAMEGVADVTTAVAGLGGMTYNASGVIGGLAGTAVTAPVQAVNNGIEDIHDHIWDRYPYQITDPDGQEDWPDDFEPSESNPHFYETDIEKDTGRMSNSMRGFNAADPDTDGED